MCVHCFEVKCTLQSSESVLQTSVTNEEIATFVDANDEHVEEISATITEVTTGDLQQHGELAKFLERPVRIHDYSWLESAAAGFVADIEPWDLFLNSTQVKSKLNNYAWFRGKLHLKFVITASPFYYGLLLASYCPIPDYVDAAAGTGTYSYMGRSQRPHIMITAADSKGGELIVPFVYPRQFINIKERQKAKDLGVVTFQILSQLRSANGVTGSGVTVQVYAWMSDVELHGPTVGLALQSKSYTETGAVSAAASTVAGIASKMKTWPFVGKFAQATEIGATALGNVASIFGFTNVPVLESAMPVRPSPFPQLASTEIGYPVEKLTVDPKNELAIDGAPVNLELEDELQIASIAQRDSILTISTINTSDVVDQQLFRMAVTPDLWNREVFADYDENYLTPLAFAAQPFKYWRGDVIVRLDFIKSKYHRGRIIASWEPAATAGDNVSTATDAMGRAITSVLDLGAESSLEMRIPYNQAVPWLQMYRGYQSQYAVRGSNVNQANYDQRYHNGLLTVRVLNVLTAPVATSTVDFVVSIRGADNIEFANPTQLPNWSRFVTQSLVFNEPAQQADLGSVSGTSDNLYKVSMGEAVRSFRTLIRRSALNEVIVVPTDTTNHLGYFWTRRTRYPVPPGYCVGGFQQARNVDDTANVSYNWSILHLISYLAPCFAGARGSVMWHLNAINMSGGFNTPTPIRVVRSPQFASTGGGLITQATKTGANDARFYAVNCEHEETGAALTTTTTNQGLSVSIPNQTPALFQSCTWDAMTKGASTEAIIDDSDYFTTEAIYYPSQGQTTRAAYIERYCAAGTDFTFVNFINVPLWYSYAATPSAPV